MLTNLFLLSLSLVSAQFGIGMFPSQGQTTAGNGVGNSNGASNSNGVGSSGNQGVGSSQGNQGGSQTSSGQTNFPSGSQPSRPLPLPNNQTASAPTSSQTVNPVPPPVYSYPPPKFANFARSRSQDLFFLVTILLL